MDKIKKYFINCQDCKKKTIHVIYNINPRRGYKLRCLSCAKTKDQYINANNLTEMEENEDLFNKKEVEKDE